MVRRRPLLATAGAVVAGTAAGCLGDAAGGTTQISTAEPDGDGTATPGELRWLLTHGDHPLDVRAMRQKGNALVVRYASAATDINQFVGEIGKALDEYALYVEEGGSASRLTVHVADRKLKGYAGNDGDGQAGSFYARRRWAREMNAGELTRRRYLQKALETRTWPTARQ